MSESSVNSMSMQHVPSNVDYRHWQKVATVIILCFFNLIYYMDRFGIAGIITLIQCELDANNAQAGFLQTAFIITYVIASPLIGYLGDRYSRRWILIGGMLFWSIICLSSSFMPGLWSLIGVRSLLGIGEASFSALAPAIISDLFAQSVRSQYLAVYYLTIPVGSGLGYIVVSEISQATNSWRWGLRVTPVLGIVTVVMTFFFLIDPPRGQSDNSQHKPTSWSADVRYLVKHWSYVAISVATTAVAFVAGAFGAWGPKYITLGLFTQNSQEIGESGAVLNRVSTLFGVITVISGLLGVIIGSLMGKRLRPKYPRADPLICGWGVLISAPILFAMMLLAPGPEAPTYITFFIGQWCLNLNWALATEMLMYCIVPTRRSTAKAIQILLNHVLGDAGAPFATGLISEAFKPIIQSNTKLTPSSSTLPSYTFGKTENNCDPNAFEEETVKTEFLALQYALFVSLFVQVLGAFAFIATSWSILKDKEDAEREYVSEKTTPKLSSTEETENE